MSFHYIKPTEEQIEIMNDLRNEYEELVNKITSTVSPSRGLSIAITKLEESSFWLNKAITHNDE